MRKEKTLNLENTIKDFCEFAKNSYKDYSDFFELDSIRDRLSIERTISLSYNGLALSGLKLIFKGDNEIYICANIFDAKITSYRSVYSLDKSAEEIAQSILSVYPNIENIEVLDLDAKYKRAFRRQLMSKLEDSLVGEN